MFGSTAEIRLRGADPDAAQAALSELSAVLNQRHREWHAWEPSDVTRINEAFAAGQPAEAPDSVRELVRLAQPLYDTYELATMLLPGLPAYSLAALAQVARMHGDKTFIVYEDERVSYDAWFRAAVTLAHHLQAAGIGKGDRVALAMRNLPEWPVAFFAIVSIIPMIWLLLAPSKEDADITNRHPDTDT